MTTSALTGPLLGQIPAGLRGPLLRSFDQIVRNFRQSRWEPAELNGGKLCEVVYSVLAGHVKGVFPVKPTQPINMVDECRKLEKADSSVFPRSVRIQVPRLLMGLYEIRNNRGVGHVGGDVDPNHMDAVLVLAIAKWLVAELVRLFHDVDTETATRAVELLTEREVPLIWEVDGKRRVLDVSLPMKDKTLLIAYGHAGPVREVDLVTWLEHSNPSVYRRDVLINAHKKKLIEYNKEARLVSISPLGEKYVEDNLDLG